MKDYQKLKEIIQKANPEIMELKFGCYVNFEGEKIIVDVHGDIVKTKSMDIHKNHIKILGRPIRLADVLMAIEKKNPDIMIDVSGRFLLNEQPAPLCQECSWNLKDNNLDNQSDETKQFLIDILTKE